MSPIGWKRYRKWSGEIVDAYTVSRPRPIPTPCGIEWAMPGWYVYHNEDGELWTESKEVFEGLFTPENGPPKWTGSGI